VSPPGRIGSVAAVVAAALVLPSAHASAGPREAGAAEPGITFEVSAAEVEAFDFVEVTVRVDGARAANPFTDAHVNGSFGPSGGPTTEVEGFADAEDGSVYRIRFMPRGASEHRYEVRYEHGDRGAYHRGTFLARDAMRKGLLRVDEAYPFHFVWEGTGEHYFWNGTTTYWLLGWDDETMRASVERLARLKVNRLRVALDGRVKDGRDWYENVFPTDRFSFRLDPWVAARPDSLADPGFDVARFNLPHWQKAERLLGLAREHDVVVSVVFYVDGAKPGVDPFGRAGEGGEAEERYYRYAVARFGAFSNVTWDLSNEYRLLRSDAWAERMGARVKAWDPYDHLASTHGFEDFRFRTSPWADFALYQMWDECGGYPFMLLNRQLQAATGRPMPQINEEYGYEDHYPPWGCGKHEPPTRSADNRRRLAWEMAMAGTYQTTGERADRGTGWGPDTGGGWINGRGDDTMVMLAGYARMVDFFTGFEWWRLEPRNELVTHGLLCLAEPGQRYVVYFRWKMPAAIRLEPGRYRARWYNPRTGDWVGIGIVEGPSWTSPAPADGEDWALLLEKTD